jgi:hypothetical protein
LAFLPLSFLLKLLIQLFFSKFRWLVTGFSLTIKIFAFSPLMGSRKKAPVVDKANHVPYSFRARVFIAPHTRLIACCDPPAQSVQCREIMNTPYDCSTEIKFIATQGIVGTYTHPELLQFFYEGLHKDVEVFSWRLWTWNQQRHHKV